MSFTMNSPIVKQFSSIFANAAYLECEKGHNGRWTRTCHTLDSSLRDSWRYNKKKIAGKVLLIGGGIAVGVLTGGIGLGIIAAIAGAKYLISKIFNEISNQKQKKRLRKYIKGNPEGDKLRKGENLNLLTEDACAAIKKTWVHLRIATELALDYKKNMGDLAQPETCEDAIAPAQTAMNFIHHFDKGRGYLVPAYLLCAKLIEEYIKFSDNWSQINSKMELIITQQMANFLNTGGQDFIKKMGKLLNVDSSSSNLMEDSFRPTTESSENLVNYSGKGVFGQKSMRTVDIEDVLKNLNDTMESSIHAYETHRAPIDFSKHALKEAFNLLSPNQLKKNKLSRWIGMESQSILRFELLLKQLLEKFDNPNIFRKIHHRFRNWNLANSKGKKFISILNEAIDVGSSVGGVSIGVSDALEKSSKIFIKSANSLTANTLSFTNEWVTFRYGAKKSMMESDLLTLEENAIANSITNDKDVKKYATVVSEKLFKKAAHHFKKGIDKSKDIEKKSSDVSTISKLFDYAQAIYEVHHHFDKMERYLMTSILVSLFMMLRVELLAEEEKRIITFVDSFTKPFVIGNFNHINCLSKGSICYGPRIDQSGNYYAKPHEPL